MPSRFQRVRYPYIVRHPVGSRSTTVPRRRREQSERSRRAAAHTAHICGYAATGSDRTGGGAEPHERRVTIIERKWLLVLLVSQTVNLVLQCATLPLCLIFSACFRHHFYALFCFCMRPAGHTLTVRQIY